MTTKSKVPIDPDRDAQFDVAFERLTQLVDRQHADRLHPARSDTFHKELLRSVVSYNLVSQFRRHAAELVSEPPRRMSFKRVWTTSRQFLLP